MKNDNFFEAVLSEASTAAAVAIDKYLETNPHWYPCGFAWVNVPDGRSAFAKYLKRKNIGSKNYSSSGVRISLYKAVNHPEIHSQSMNLKYAAAVAYVEVLNKYNLNSYADSRID